MTPEQLIAGIRAKQQESASAEQEEQNFAREQVVEIINEIHASNARLVKAIQAAKPDPVTIPDYPEFPAFPKSLDTGNKEVVKAIKDLKFPESDDTKVVEALKRLESQNVQIASLLSKLDLHVEAPQVNVEAPDFKPVIKAIKEAKPEPVSIDFTELIKKQDANLKAIKEVSKTLMNLRFPVANTPTDPLILYMVADVDDATTTQYFGHTQVGGAWYIRKFDKSVSPKTNRFVFGQSGYSTAWAGRAGLTYTIWGQ